MCPNYMGGNADEDYTDGWTPWNEGGGINLRTDQLAKRQ